MWFLSYNSRDVETARTLGALLLTQKVRVWFDEWHISPGDSIVHEINAGLEQASGMFALWSKNAARSAWVELELNAAVSRMQRERNTRKRQRFRVIPVLIDGTRLPPLLSDISAINWAADRTRALTQIFDAAGKKAVDRSRILMGLNNLIGELGAQTFSAVPVVACPECGAEDLKEFRASDPFRGDEYACIECNNCGWQDGQEV
jgi:hypothetical protein